MTGLRGGRRTLRRDYDVYHREERVKDRSEAEISRKAVKQASHEIRSSPASTFTGTKSTLGWSLCLIHRHDLKVSAEIRRLRLISC